MRKRVTAATLLLLILHLTVVGSGMLWAESTSVDCGSAQDMAGMMMDMPTNASDAPSSSVPDDASSGCDLPWAYGCTSVAACGATATPVIAEAHDHARRAHIGVASAVQLIPASIAAAPEIPPPRA